MNEKQKEAVRTYFNIISDDYEKACNNKDLNTLRSYIFSLRKHHVLKMFDLKGGRVLDVGCGPAVFTAELLKNDCEVWGIDVSEAMIERANKRMGKKRFKRNFYFKTGDIEKLDFPSGYFDFVLCVGVLEYLREDSLALSELRRVLKDKGKVIFTVPNIASPFSLLDKLLVITIKIFIRILKCANIKIKNTKNSLFFVDDLNDRYYSPYRFNRQLSNNGFEIEKATFHIYRLAALNLISPSLSLFLSRKMEVLSRTPFYWAGINYIVRASKN